MASILKVDKLDPQSGTALEIGTSGDTITVPSGATLDISSATLTPPATMPASSAANLTSIPAANLTGTIAAISGANVTSLDAGNISAGTLAIARGGTGAATLVAAGLANTPSFHVYRSGSQSLVDATVTKCTFANEVWDSDDCYDSTTNYRFTPTTAGKYFFYCQLALDQGASANQVTQAVVEIRKSGTTVSYDTHDNRSSSFGYSQILTSTCCVEMDGTSDYVEGWGYLDWASGAAVLAGSAAQCFFGGWRLIGV